MSACKLILIGSGDFAIEVAEYIVENNHNTQNEELIISDIVAPSESRYNEFFSVLGYTPKYHKILDTIKYKDDKKAIICLGLAEWRNDFYKELKEKKFNIYTFVHKTAWISNSAKINEGAIICPYVFIGANAIVGANTSINVRATIGHDVKIGESVVISPHVNINGRSKCGDVSFIGAGTIMDPESSIGNFSKVSSGALLKDSFGDGFLITGSPAKGRQMFKSKN